MANGLQQAGLALQGLSAGLQGKGLAFNQQLIGSVSLRCHGSVLCDNPAFATMTLMR